jgi:hypothetical protein
VVMGWSCTSTSVRCGAACPTSRWCSSSNRCARVPAWSRGRGVHCCLPNLKVVQQLKQVRQGARLVSREGSPLLPAQPKSGAAAQTGAPGCPPGLEGGESIAACPTQRWRSSSNRCARVPAWSRGRGVHCCLPNLKVVQQLKQVRQGARLVSREGSPLLPAQPQGGAAAQTGAPGCPPGLEGGESTAACPKTLSLTSHTRYPLCLLSLPPAYSEAKVANRDGTDFGGGSLTRPFRDARRFPSPRS